MPVAAKIIKVIFGYAPNHAQHCRPSPEPLTEILIVLGIIALARSFGGKMFRVIGGSLCGVDMDMDAKHS